MNRYLIQSCCCLVALSQLCSGAVVFDSGGFEAYTPNTTLVNQTGGGTLPWSDFNAPTGNRFTVQSAITNGGDRAVSVSASDEVAAFVAPAVNFTPSVGESVIIEVDIARTIALIPIQPSSNGFNVDVYNPGGGRILGFGLQVNATNNGVEAFVTRGDGSLFGVSEVLSLAVAEVNAATKRTEFISFRAELNFDADTFTLLASGINGTVDTGVLQFVNDSTTLGDADLQHDSVVNAQDVGYFDNYSISTVPEPGAMSMGCFVLAGMLFRRRRA